MNICIYFNHLSQTSYYEKNASLSTFSSLSSGNSIISERNPSYWCFISKTQEEVTQENDYYTRIVTSTVQFMFMLPKRTDQQKKVARLLTGLSLPSTARHFSSAQIQKQRIFFLIVFY